MSFHIEYIGNPSIEFKNECEGFIELWENNLEEIEVQTSGSTGEPKKFKVRKSSMLKSAQATGKFFDFIKGQSILLCMSPKFIGGKMILVRAKEFGLKVIACEPSKNPLTLINSPVDFAAFVPLQIKEILEDDSTLRKYENIPNVIIGGAQLGVKEFEILTGLSNSSYQTFGMTETLSHFALKKISSSNDLYECLPGWSIESKDGQLLIKENDVIEADLLTNDIIEIQNERFFRFIGRADNAINSGGIKMFPEKIEAKIGDLIKERYYISKKQDEKWGEAIVLVLESETMIDIEPLRTKLESMEMPKEIILQSKFKETGSGKVIRETF